jgi:hypothetical protein
MTTDTARPEARTRRRRTLVAAFIALGSLAAFAPRADAAPAQRYVALGDSFTADPLTGPLDLDHAGCARSLTDYPHRTAAAIGAVSFRDVSCSGATAAHVTAVQSITGGTNPAQLAAVDTTTTVVTMGFGGNDIGFVNIITGCAAILPFGAPCRNKYAPAGGVDQLAARIDAAGPGIGSAIAAVRAKAPNAKVYVVGYPALLPESGSCFPQMPYTPTDVGYLRGVNQRLNSMLQNQAVSRGAIYVDVYTPSVGHDACKTRTTRWIEPIVPGNPAAPVHPNAAGAAGQAAAVTAAIRATS